MLGFVLTAALALGARPADLVKPREEALYAAWLEGEARAAVAYYAHADCASAALTPLSFKPVADEGIAKARPGAKLYAETFAVQGCGEARAQTLVVTRETANWRAFRAAPGESVASLELQRRVLPDLILAVKAASDADTSCSGLDKARSARVYDTRVTRPAAGQDQPWAERWFMAVCEAGYKIDIEFTPADGKVGYQVHIAQEPATAQRGLGLLRKQSGE